jgi:Mrp family chromosome partitioning ATPase
LAAQDLIISRRGPAPSAPYYDSDPASPDSTGPDGAAVLFSTLRKRWLLMVVIGIVSGGLATLAAWQFGHETAVIKAAVIYTGLTNPGATGAFDPLGAATGAELVTSVKVLSQLCSRRGLEMPPARMAELITTSVGRSSSLINLSLTWRDVDDGISLLNELTGIFIEEMASQRKAILLQHLQHLDIALVQAKGRVDEARSQLAGLQSQQRQQLDKGGLSNDKYRSATLNIDTTKAKADDKRTELLGTNEQIVQLTSSIEEFVKKQQSVADSVKKDLLHEAEGVLTKARNEYRPSSDGARQINDTIAAITKLVQSPKAPKEFEQWQKQLAEIVQRNNNGLTDSARKKLEETFARIQQQHDGEINTLDAQRRKVEEQRSQLQLGLILIKKQLASLEQQLAEHQKKADKLGEQITGISATQLDEAEHQLQEAEKQQDNLADQSTTLRQLSETRIREWSVTIPASMATAQVDSNRSKLFIVVFGVCCFALTAPLFVSEWHAQSDSPQVQLARSLRVPVLAERILEHFLPEQRKSKQVGSLGARQTEIVRMLTLRIQQTCHRPGSVVLFSSLDSSFSTVSLMATVAECLAEREERVLIIDAVCPRRALIPVLNVLSSDELPALPKKAKKDRSAPPPVPFSESQLTNGSSFGLSEYFSEECESVHDLVQPTGCPGVDLIASGRSGFSREAMASSCLTELLNTCRKNYTMVLIHGPAADSVADLQMLTARCDGIVLAATKDSAKDPHVREVVQDLLDLGAPLIGLVA